MILTVVVMSTGVGEGRLETTVATAERRASVAGHQHHSDKHAPPLPRQSKATDEAALRTRKRHLMTKHRDLEWNAATKTANDRLRVRCWIEPTCCNNEHIFLTGKSCRITSSMIAERRKQAATVSALKRLRKHGKSHQQTSIGSFGDHRHHRCSTTLNRKTLRQANRQSEDRTDSGGKA